jgi:hypothetical protein
MGCSTTAVRRAVNSQVTGSNPVTPVALVAQLVEQWFCKPFVASSNLVGGS